MHTKGIRLLRLKEIRDREFGKKNVLLANRLGIAPNYLSRLLRGSKGLGEDLAREFEQKLGKPVLWLDTLESDGSFSEGPDTRGLIPQISWVQAGMWSNIVDDFPPGDAEVWLPVPAGHGPNAYALKVRGISMEPLFVDGDVIYVDPALEPRSGQYVVVKLTDEQSATFKQVFFEGDAMFLKALNPLWPPEAPGQITKVDEECQLCGVVFGKWTPIS